MKYAMASHKNVGVLVDANIWIGYFDKSDSLSEKAETTLIELLSAGKKLIIPYSVMQEISTFFLYNKQVEAFTSFLDFVDQHPNIYNLGFDSLVLKNTVQFIQQHNYTPKISYTDWSLLYLNHEFQLPIATFDKQLANKAT